MRLSPSIPAGAPRLRRSLLALSLALGSAAAVAQDTAPTPDQIAERLRIVERRLGIAPVEGAASDGLAELDRRLRAVEQRSEERRVGKECRCRWAGDLETKNREEDTQ